MDGLVGKIILICVVLLLLAVIIFAIVKLRKWVLKQLDEGICPVCLLKQHTRKSELTIKIPENEYYDGGNAKTPPMGWSSWNTFRNTIDEDLIYDTAKAMVDSGLAEVGYKYINLDDCWHSPQRNEDGNLEGDPVRFKSGIGDLCKKINGLGLKMGLYSSNGTYTCEDLPASQGHELKDAKQLAAWGVEYFKYDFCHNVKLPSVAPLVERIELTDNNKTVVLKAEDATLEGMAKVKEDKKLSTGKYIAFLGFGKGKAKFKINFDENGEQLLVVFIKKKGMYDKYLVIKVNDSYIDFVSPPTHEWSPVGRHVFKVKVKKGENIIELFNPVCTKADSSYVLYKKMGEALKVAAKDKKITYSICEWGKNKPEQWAWNAGNSWRTTPDIRPSWTWMNIIYNNNMKSRDKAGPGHWNDPDMLEVGNGNLTYEQNKTHFSLWCMMAAPLILGNDLRKLVGENARTDILDIVKNRDMIAINQDELGFQCDRVKSTPIYDILVKKLSGDRVAICIYNKALTESNIEFDTDTIASEYSFNCEFKEAWSGENVTNSKLKARLKSFDCAVFVSK